MINIREYQETDSEAVTDLLKEFLSYTKKQYDKEVLEFETFSDADKDAYAKNLHASFTNIENSHFLIAENQENIIGYILGCIQTQEFKVCKKTGYIQSFFVSQNNRGAGIGKKLYSALTNWFAKHGCDSLELNVYAGNTATIETYKKWGFKLNSLKMKKKL